MPTSTHHTPITMPVLRFLFSPEDSSAPRSAGSAVWSAGWQTAKTATWIACAVLVALLVGQL